MSSVSKRATKEIDKTAQIMKMTPTTLNKLDFENAYAEMTVYREYDLNRPSEIKFQPHQVLPFAQQEREFWDQFDPKTFDIKCRFVRLLNQHLNTQRKTKNWLDEKIKELGRRTNLREVFIPAEAISTPITQTPVKKIEKLSPPPSKRAKKSPSVKESSHAEDSSSSETEKTPSKEVLGSSDMSSFEYDSDKNYELDLLSFNAAFIKYARAKKEYNSRWSNLKDAAKKLPGKCDFNIDGTSLKDE